MRSVPRAVATGSQSTRRSSLPGHDPVATALGTDLITPQLARSLIQLSGPLAAQKILLHITHGIIQRIAGISRGETEFAAGLGVIEVPEVLCHFYRIGFDRRGEVPLPKE